MITKKTVLILGAGASAPFGFPSGEDLVTKMCTELRNGQARAHIDALLQESHFAGDYDHFLDTLAKSGRTSIDEFLQHSREFLQMGKLGIAAVLIPLEQEARLFEFKKANWYKLLFTQLNTDFETFSENRLSIITFNYDRSLEQFLLTALRNSYPSASFRECMDRIHAMPVIHMHGQLGALPADEHNYDEKARGYEPTLSPHALQLSAKSIRILHEEVEKSPAFQNARDRIAAAEIVAFLGFGYNQLNLQRLNVRDQALSARVSGGKQFFGTSFKLGRAKEKWVEGYFHDHISVADTTVDGLLSDYPILLHPPQMTDRI